MKGIGKRASVVRIIAVCAGTWAAGVVRAAPGPAGIEEAVAAAARLDYGQSRKALWALERLINETHGRAQLRAEIEQQLVRQLEGSASPAAKQFFCRKLWMIGTGASVPALARLLIGADAHAAEIACYALNRHPSPAAGAALRGALGKGKGQALLAVVNLLGDRRDAQAVEPLAALASGTDAAAADAAIAALGKIATPRALELLARLDDPELFDWLQYTLGDERVRFDFVVFLGCQFPRLVQGLFADPHLPDVVQQPGESHVFHLLRRKRKGSGHSNGTLGDTPRVALCVRVFRFQYVCEGRDRIEQQKSDLPVLLQKFSRRVLDLAFEIPLIDLALHVQSSPLESSLHVENHILQVKWLHDIVVRSQLHCLDGFCRLRHTCDHNNLQVRVDVLRCCKELNTIHLWHPNISQHDLEGIVLNATERGGAVSRNLTLISLHCQSS